MAAHKNKQKITIETLLKIKRNERPQGEFWDTFDQNFQRRRLNALVERPAWRDWLVNPSVKALVFALPALTLMALAVVWSRMEWVSPQSVSAVAAVGHDSPVKPFAVPEQQPDRVTQHQTYLDSSLASNQFVVDAIEDRSGATRHFRKVLYTPAIRLSAPSGASYVRDNLSSRTYNVTTADVQLGRNF